MRGSAGACVLKKLLRAHPIPPAREIQLKSFLPEEDVSLRLASARAENSPQLPGDFTSELADMKGNHQSG